jgi:hypothetical protein
MLHIFREWWLAFFADGYRGKRAPSIGPYFPVFRVILHNFHGRLTSDSCFVIKGSKSNHPLKNPLKHQKRAGESETGFFLQRKKDFFLHLKKI